MAVTLESGSYVKFQYNLGTGPIDIINWAVKVRPGYWYTAYATRSVRVLRDVTAAIFSVPKLNNEVSLLSVWEMSSLITQKIPKHLYMPRKCVSLK